MWWRYRKTIFVIYPPHGLLTYNLLAVTFIVIATVTVKVIGWKVFMNVREKERKLCHMKKDFQLYPYKLSFWLRLF